MPFPGRHIETGSLLGSWPILPSVLAGVPLVLPRTVQSLATIRSIRREPASGFDVDTRSFYLKVDSTAYPVAFSYGSFLPLSVVISQINAAVGFTVAYNDNGFLKLQSPTAGTGYLKVYTDGSSTPTNVLLNLGLFSEVEAYSGDLTQTQNPDPDRQVATPSQMTMAEGESYEARVVNRAIAQLSVNNDRNEGLLSKKRLAVQDSYQIGSYTKPTPCHGVQLSGGNLVYVGKTATPTVDQLKKLFAVLDSSNREFSKDIYVPAFTGWTGTFAITADGTNRQQVLSASIAGLTESTAEKQYYVLSTAFTGGATVFNGKPLKILEVDVGATTAIIENIDPATGQRVTITQAGVSFSIVSRVRAEVVVDGVYADETNAGAGTNRLEGTRYDKRTGIAPTRVELGNRVVFVGQDFTAATAIQVGDVFTWKNSTVNDPFNNNGEYRVDKIIDKETLQVVAGDWSAAVLNPSTSGTVGVVDISTDGNFALDPFLRFSSSATTYAQPDNGDSINIALFNGKSFRKAADDNPALFGSEVTFNQEADDSIARAVTRMWGPSVTSVDQILYQDERINIESLNSRLNWEHYNYDDAEKTGSSALDTRSWGRHKDVRPDTIDMWYWTPSLTTPRVTLRGTGTRGHADTNLDTDEVFQIRNSSGYVTLRTLSDGRSNNFSANGNDNVLYWRDYRFREPTTPIESNLGNQSISGERTIWRGEHSWNGAVADPGGIVSLVGQNLSTYLSLTTSTTNRFLSVIGQKLRVFSDAGNTIWATTVKFLELSGAMQKSVTDYGDNRDAVTNLYGIHVNYTVSSNFKILTAHYGIKIENIEKSPSSSGVHSNNVEGTQFAAQFRGGTTTTTASSGLAYGVFLGTVSSGSSFCGAVGVFVNAVSVGTDGVASGISVGTISGTGQTHYGANFGAVSGAAATNYGINLGTVSGAATNNYGLKLANVSGGTNNYAIYSGTGLVYFGDRLEIAAPANSLYGISVDGWSSNTNITGITVGALTTTNGTAYGLSVGVMTSSGTNAAYGLSIAAPVNTGGAGPTAGISLALSDTASTSYGLTMAGVTTSVANVFALQTGSVTSSKVGGLVVGLSLGAATAPGSTYGISMGIMTANGSGGAAYGINVGSVVSSHATSSTAFGIKVGAVSQSGTSTGYAVGLELASSSSPLLSYGINTGTSSASASAGVAYGVYVGAASADVATGTSYGVYVAAPSAAGGTSAMGIRVGMPTSGPTMYGINVASGTSSSATTMLGLNIGDLSTSAGTCSGVVILSSTGTSSAKGIDIGTVTATASSGSGVGISIGQIVANGTGGSARAIDITGGATADAAITLINMGSMSDSVTGNKSYITTGNMTGTAANNYGIYLGSVSGGTNNYAIYTNSGRLRFGSAAADECYIIGATDTGTSTTSALYINTTDGQLGLNSSSIKVKKDVVDMGDTGWLYQTRPVKFRFKHNDELSYGLVAEELFDLAPDFVFFRPDEESVENDYQPQPWELVKDKDGKKYKRDFGGIHYDRLIPVIINELKKLKAEVDALKP